MEQSNVRRCLASYIGFARPASTSHDIICVALGRGPQSAAPSDRSPCSECVQQSRDERLAASSSPCRCSSSSLSAACYRQRPPESEVRLAWIRASRQSSERQTCARCMQRVHASRHRRASLGELRQRGWGAKLRGNRNTQSKPLFTSIHRILPEPLTTESGTITESHRPFPKESRCITVRAAPPLAP